MKKGLLAFLVLFILQNAPWRLAALVAETLVMPTGYVRLSDSNTEYWEAQDLEHRLESLGWQVIYQNGMLDEIGVLGMTSVAEHKVLIDSSLSWNERYITLAHEAGHCLQPRRLSPNQAEAFAESRRSSPAAVSENMRAGCRA